MLRLLPLLLALPLAAWAQGAFTCTRTDAAVPLRAQGTTELLADIVLSCTGGTPTPAGNALPQYQLLITSTLPITSRTLVAGATTTSGLIESLLIVDDPPFFTAQIGCESSLAGLPCPGIAGEAANPNVFQARQVQANALLFRGVSFDQPGPSQTRTLRITNLRVNAASSTAPGQVTLQLFNSSGAAIPIRDPGTSLATTVSGGALSIRTLADAAPALPAAAVATLPPSSLPVGAPNTAVGFNVKFTEGFAGAFRRRNVATTPDLPLQATIQAIPGVRYSTETGFFNSQLPEATGMNTAGLADTGTRLRAVFHNVPRDVLLWVSVRDVPNGTSVYTDSSPRAILVSTDSRGAGATTPLRATLNGYYQIPVAANTATAVWEVVSANPETIQSISFAVAVSLQNASPGLGTITVSGGLAPVLDAAGTVVTTPAFLDTSKNINAFGISNTVTVPAVSVVSAASFTGPAAAPGSIASAFGSALGTVTAQAASATLPTTLGGLAVDLIDSVGIKRPAGLFFVSPTQINFLVDPAIPAGPVLVTVTNNGLAVASGYLQVAAVAPGLFSANGDGRGVYAGDALLVSGTSSTRYPVAAYDPARASWIAAPVPSGANDDLLVLTLYGTGIRHRASISDVQATINGVAIPVLYAGPQGAYTGLDQVNIGPLPKSLRGAGLADLTLRVAGQSSNTLQVQLQ